MSRASAMAGAVAGLALWVSLGSFDTVDGVDRALRVAMLPPFWLAAVLIATGAIISVAVTRLVSRVATGASATPQVDAEDVVRPLWVSGLLVLPVLPWLSDLVPAWTTLAGPFIALVWTVIGALVARAAWLRIRQARTWSMPRLPFSSTVGVLIASAMMTGAAAARLVETPIFPGGDEPHYLVIAQSLWRDGDLRIENNHRRGDTLEYFSRPLKPDYLTRGVDRQIYSVHPIGIGVLLAPVYALGGYRGVVAFFVLVAALAAACAWRVTARLTDARAAVFAWLACAMTAPWVFNSFTVYPEVPAALAVIVAFSLAIRVNEVRDRERLLGSMGACGLAIATLPWLSSKYALMGAALGLVTMARLWLPHWLQASDAVPTKRSVADRVAASLAAAAAPIVSGLAWLMFFKRVWGTFSPSAPYGNQHAMDLAFLAAGGPGLYFDQEYGVVSAAPVLLLALLGLVGMLRRGGNERRLAIEIALVSISLLITVAAFHIWWGGTASVGRPIISALLLLMLPCAWQVRAWATSRSLTAAAWLLLIVSLTITATLALAVQGLLLVADRDGSSRLLDYWSPFWPLSTIAPTFIMQSALRGVAITAVWIAAIAGALALLRRTRDEGEGRAGLRAAGAAFAALTAIALVLTPFASQAAAKGRLPSARVRSPLLDTFDASRRPVGVVFDPLRVVKASDLLARVRFAAGPDLPRTAPTPTLLYQARWAWPAGEYEVTAAPLPGSTPIGGQLSLQTGRAGPPLITWTVEPTASTWRGRVALPIDVGFVGFLASPELAAAKPRLEIRPVTIVDRSRRLPLLEVIQARTLGHTLVFFHDDNADPEGRGFWTRGDRTTRVTLASVAPGAMLRLRSGPVAVRTVVRLGGRAEVVDLSPDTPRDLPLPRASGPQRLEIVTRGGFVPSERDPAVRDSRALGCWIEVSGGG